MSEIESRVKSIIVEKLNVDEAEVKPEASFTNDLVGINIPDDQAEKIATVGDAIAYIEQNAK